MMIATYTGEQVRRDELIEHISKLIELKQASLTSTRNTAERFYEIKIQVPLNQGSQTVADALTRLSTDAALD
jgi:hypothetical protein